MTGIMTPASAFAAAEPTLYGRIYGCIMLLQLVYMIQLYVPRLPRWLPELLL